MDFFLRRLGIYFISIILVICFFIVNGFFDNKKSEIIKGDGFGYYAYLPTVFIYGDYSQDFVKAKFSKYYSSDVPPEYMDLYGNKLANKYFIGTAVLIYPFFITAHLLSFYFHQPADGYSVLYQYFAGLSAIFYVFIGIYFCERLLRIYGANTKQSLFICLLLVFGTNLYFYAVVEPTMSHAFSFATISAFLFFAKGVLDFKKTKYIIPAFISLGLLVIIRPFNIFILLSLPFLAGSFRKLKESIRFMFRHYFLLSFGIVLTLLIIFIQFFIWYKQTGHLIIYSYTGERFYFNRPNIINVLFSYRKGFFIYSPLFFLSLIGFIYLYQKNRFSTYALLIFIYLLVYVMSCWHLWFYGSSFGFRPLIDYYSLFALLLLFSLNYFRKRILRNLFISFCLFALFINQVQAYQYRKYILHWYNMSYYKYWRVFLKTDIKWSGYIWDNPEPSELPGTTVSKFSSSFENAERAWSGSSLLNIGNKAHSGRMVTGVDINNLYSNTIELGSNSKIYECKAPAIIATGYIHVNNYFASDKLSLVVNYQKEDGNTYYYRSRLVDNLFRDQNGWKRFEIGLRLQRIESISDSIKIYFWNPEKKSFWIDDVTFKFIDVK